MTPGKEKEVIEDFNSIVGECKEKVKYANKIKDYDTFDLLNFDEMKTVIKYQRIMNQRIKSQNRFIKELAVENQETMNDMTREYTEQANINFNLHIENRELKQRIAELENSLTIRGNEEYKLNS